MPLLREFISCAKAFVVHTDSIEVMLIFSCSAQLFIEKENKLWTEQLTTAQLGNLLLYNARISLMVECYQK